MGKFCLPAAARQRPTVSGRQDKESEARNSQEVPQQEREAMRGWNIQIETHGATCLHVAYKPAYMHDLAYKNSKRSHMQEVSSKICSGRREPHPFDSERASE